MPLIGYCRNLHNNLCPCFLCSKKFSLDNGIEDLLTHICFTHRVVIDNIDRIADFKKYMDYYVTRYQEEPLELFTKQFTIDVTESDSQQREQKYYLLGDFLPEDENLRKNLHAERLKAAQIQQKIDLEPNYFWRHCFYCHQTLEVTNVQFVNHLKCHGFQLGHPEKLVYVDKFIEAIEDTFRNLHCLYCEMEFESCRALIHHMEKKGHLKTHPNNRFYDQFYMINYVEFGKTWLDFVKQKKSDPKQLVVKTNDDTDWSSWGTEPENIKCLFCEHICRSWDGTLLHMHVSHNFDFKNEISHFLFYQQVKVVNYIRHRILNERCINCDFQSDGKFNIVHHMEQTNHLKIPDQDLWDHDEYLFCALENDMLLCHLEDNADGSDTEADFELNTNVDPVEVTRTDNAVSHSGLSHNISSMDRVDISSSTNDFIFVGKAVRNFFNSRTKKTELCSSAHMGAGDSLQNIEITKRNNVIEVDEFRDA